MRIDDQTSHESLLPNKRPSPQNERGVLLGVAGLGLDPVDSLLFSIGRALESGSPLTWSTNCADCTFQVRTSKGSVP